jgi:poly-gamma-glutamate capsule biosynthesis protein CapA/YwtB (metallophosphatase superfamily)
LPLSNFPLAYKLSWLPRLLLPSVHGMPGPHERVLLPEVARTVRLAFLGDISAVANRTAPAIDGQLRALLSSADLVVANCESPVVANPTVPAGRFGRRHAMSPVFLLELLEATGMDARKLVLSVANNHILDQGPAGFDETLASLDRMRVRTVGAVRDGMPRRILVGGVTIAFAAFTAWRNGPSESFAGRAMTSDDLAANGWKNVTSHYADLLCVLPHWGWEFRAQPRPETRALARLLMQQGAGLIAGSHPHIVQSVEQMGAAVVAYSLGDFVGTAWPIVSQPLRTGAVLLADVSAEGGTLGKVARYRLELIRRDRAADHETLSLPTA